MLADAASILFTDLGKMYKWLAAVVLALGGVALILTYSRGAWLALVLATIVICFVIGRQRGTSLKAPIAILVILAALYVPFGGSISARLFGDDRGAAESPLPLDELAFRIIGANPLLGVGPNNFTVAMDQYAPSEFLPQWLLAL